MLAEYMFLYDVMIQKYIYKNAWNETCIYQWFPVQSQLALNKGASKRFIM